MSSRKYTLYNIISLILISAVAAYVAGGVIYARHPNWAMHNKNILLLFIIFLTLIVISYIILSRHYDIRGRLCSFYNGINLFDRRKEFCTFYNIRRYDIAILSGLIILGAILRICGYNWGLVGSWQPDEPHVISSCIDMAGYRTVYSDNVYYPNQLLSKVAAVAIWAYSRLFHTDANILTSPWAFFIFRFLVAIVSTLCIYTAFLIGNSIRPRMGIILAGLVCIYPQFIVISKQATGDIPVFFCLTLTLLFSIRYTDNEKLIYLSLMCMGAAMATLEKWHGAVGIGYIGVFLLFNCHGIMSYIKRGISALLFYAMWLFIFAPNVIVNFRQSIEDGFLKLAEYDEETIDPLFSELLTLYTGYGIKHIAGVIFILLIITGIVFVIIKHDKKTLILLLGPIKVICLCLMNRSFPRWALELYLTELFLIAFAIIALTEYGRAIRITAYVAISVIILELATASLLVAIVASSPEHDSCLVQRHKCESMGITPDNMISQWYTGFGPTSRCDGEYPGTVTHVRDWGKYIIELDGILYRTSDTYSYICLAPSQYSIDFELSERLSTECNKLIEQRTVCGNVFNIPFLATKLTYNDFMIIANNIRMITSIYNGGLTGQNIDIYDISTLPVTVIADLSE